MTTNEVAARELALQFRQQYGLESGPIDDVFEMLHRTIGVDAFSVEASEAEHGLTMMDTTTNRLVVVVATTPHPFRQRSSLAHELGHILADDVVRKPATVHGGRDDAEIQADSFARHLLLPMVDVRRRNAAARTDPMHALSQLVHEYEVSPQMAAIQMRAARQIDEHAKQTFLRLTARNLAAKYGWLSKYDIWSEAAQRARAPQSLMARAAEAYQNGLLGLTELALWYGRPADELRAELGEPPESEVFDDDWGIGESVFQRSDG